MSDCLTDEWDPNAAAESAHNEPPAEWEPEILYPAKLNKSALRDTIRHIEANGDGALARVLVALLGETQRAEAAQQRCVELEREVHDLRNWMQGAACRLDHAETRLDRAGIPDFNANPDSFMDGIEPVAIRCEAHGITHDADKSCSMCEPSVASLRGEPPLIYLRKAEPRPRPFVHMRDIDGPRTDTGNRTVCTYPCYKCDPEAFTNEWAQNEARRLNVRESA